MLGCVDVMSSNTWKRAEVRFLRQMRPTFYGWENYCNKKCIGVGLVPRPPIPFGAHSSRSASPPSLHRASRSRAFRIPGPPGVKPRASVVPVRRSSITLLSKKCKRLAAAEGG
eukprot:2306438-Prymnesium_polylepis.1